MIPSHRKDSNVLFVFGIHFSLPFSKHGSRFRIFSAFFFSTHPALRNGALLKKTKTNKPPQTSGTCFNGGKILIGG